MDFNFEGNEKNKCQECCLFDDKVYDECGVFGIYSSGNIDVARLTYYGLYALQHRGEESAGIAVNDNGTILYHKDMGTVSDVFNDTVINHLQGKIAIGHVRYSTTGASARENAQPVVINYKNGQIALAHNGNLVNAAQLRNKLAEDGAIFQSTIDSEVILNLISRFRISTTTIEEAIQKTMEQVKGSYALVILTSDKLIGIRDPHGLRPLCIGKLDNSYILASESCAVDAVGGIFIRDVEPGEIVIIDSNGIQSIKTPKQSKSSLCVFEFVYLARTDSVIDGASVHTSRLEAGKKLAIEHPVDADLVMGVPDGGSTPALGFSIQSGIPYAQGLLKNRYIGRYFIKPEQRQRDMVVRIKYNAIKSVIDGKRIVLVDDSIVRGTTTGRLVQLLKDAGAKEVHMRISSPPYKYPCYFGIDTPSKTQLVASTNTIEQIKNIIGSDSLGYLSLDGLLSTPVGATCGFCTACFNGQYPMDVPEEGDKFSLDDRRKKC